MPTFSVPGNLRVDDADVSELLECSSPDSATELALDAFEDSAMYHLLRKRSTKDFSSSQTRICCSCSEKAVVAECQATKMVNAQQNQATSNLHGGAHCSMCLAVVELIETFASQHRWIPHCYFVP